MAKNTGKKEKSIFAKNIISRRKELKLDQPALAHEIGVHKNTIIAIENDDGGSRRNREKLAKFFNTTVDELNQPATKNALPKELLTEIKAAVREGAAERNTSEKILIYEYERAEPLDQILSHYLLTRDRRYLAAFREARARISDAEALRLAEAHLDEAIIEMSRLKHR